MKHRVFRSGQEGRSGQEEGGGCPPGVPVNSERLLDRLAAGVVVRMGKRVVESHSAQYAVCVESFTGTGMGTEWLGCEWHLPDEFKAPIVCC